MKKKTGIKLVITDIDEKQKKNKRMHGCVKGNAPNTGTAYINGTFNVNKAKNELKKYITNILNLDIGIINAQYPYTAITELLALYIVRASAKFNTKSSVKADLYEITFENMRRAIRESDEFGYDIKKLSNDFNSTISYINNFFESEKILRTFLEEKAFVNTTNVHINNESLNFICYILSHVMSYLTKTATILSCYAKKKKVLIRNFKYACEIHFSGELGHLLNQRISEIETLFTNNKDGDEHNDSKNKEKDNDDVEVEEDEEEEEEEELDEEEEEDEEDD